LTLEDLASVERLPTAGPGRPPVKVTPETIQVPPGRRGDCMLYGNRRMGHNIHFEKAGEYLVTVRATGYERQQRGVAKRDLSVYVGTEAVGSVDVPDGARQYVIPIQAPGGVQDLDLMVTWNGGPVEIHEITIECQPGKGRKAE